MKKAVIILLAVCVFIFSGVVFIKPLVVIFTGKKLENIFLESRVKIGKCVFHPARELRLNDIEIVRKDIYTIKLKQAVIRYDLFSILKPMPLRLFLKNPDLAVTISGKEILKLEQYLNLGRGSPIFRSVEVSAFNLKADILGMSGLELRDGFLRQDFNSGRMDFTAPGLNCDKLNITDIKGKAELRGSGVLVYDLSANLLGGSIQADLEVGFQEQPGYSLDLKCAGLDIERFVRDFNLGEKFEMSGRLSGELELKGNGRRIELLRGDFLILEPGGRLVIKDMKFLQGMAERTRQPMDLLVESFKDCHYNDGLVRLGFEQGSVILEIEMQGETGRRNLKVVLHNFNPGEEAR